MAAVSIFPDENVGRSVCPSALAVVMQPGDQLKEGSAPRLQIVCCSALEYVTRLALQRTVAGCRALLEPSHDLVIEAPHVDGRHPLRRLFNSSPVYLAQRFADATSCPVAVH